MKHKYKTELKLVNVSLNCLIKRVESLEKQIMGTNSNIKFKGKINPTTYEFYKKLISCGLKKTIIAKVFGYANTGALYNCIKSYENRVNSKRV